MLKFLIIIIIYEISKALLVHKNNIVKILKYGKSLKTQFDWLLVRKQAKIQNKELKLINLIQLKKNLEIKHKTTSQRY